MLTLIVDRNSIRKMGCRWADTRLNRRLTMLFAGMDIAALLADEVRAMQQEQVGVRAHVPYMCMFFCCLLFEISTIIDIMLLCRSVHWMPYKNTEG